MSRKCSTMLWRRAGNEADLISVSIFIWPAITRRGPFFCSIDAAKRVVLVSTRQRLPSERGNDCLQGRRCGF